jgi:hypothetical protein
MRIGMENLLGAYLLFGVDVHFMMFREVSENIAHIPSRQSCLGRC